MIEAVIFDFDDTLYDYSLCNDKALETVFCYLQLKFNINIIKLKDVYEMINDKIKISNNYSNKFNKHIYFKQLFETFNIPLLYLNEIIMLYNNTFYDTIILFDYIIELLALLKDNNIKIALVSNNNFKQQYNKLVKLDIIKYFDYTDILS